MFPFVKHWQTKSVLQRKPRFFENAGPLVQVSEMYQLSRVHVTKVVCSAGILLGQVNVKKLVVIYSTSHVWFGVRVNEGGGDGAQQKEACLRGLLRSIMTSWLVMCHCILGKEQLMSLLKKPEALLCDKNKHLEPMSERVKQFFSQERNGLNKTSYPFTNISWYLLHFIIFQMTILECSCH